MCNIVCIHHMMLKEWYLLVVVLTGAINLGACLICDDPSEISTGTCAKILNDLESALLQDEGNLSRMRRAFFHSPTADPVLLKVVYNISYAKNITLTANAVCSISTMNSTIELKQMNITYGWTSSGVFTVFHPTILNMMQAQTPFVVLRIVHKTLNQRSPEADTFLWDGSYDLPTLHLNMHIASLTCVPSQDLFVSVLMDFNTLLKVYAGQQKTLKFIQDHEAIGFTLASTSLSTNIPPYGSDITVVNLYSLIFCFLYCVLTVCLLAFWYHCPNRKREEHLTTIDQKMRENKELIAGMVTTAVTTVALEFCARVANCILWTSAIHKESGWGIFLAVWLPQLFIFLLATTVNICGHFIVFRKKGFCTCYVTATGGDNGDATVTGDNNGDATATGDNNGDATVTGDNGDATVTGDNNGDATVTGGDNGDATVTGDNNGNATVTGDNNGDATVTGDNNGDATVTGDNNGDATVTGDNNGDATVTGGDNGDATVTGGDNGDATATGDNNGDATATGENNSCCSKCLNGTLRCLSSKVHIILTLNLTAFGLLYCLFPAIILIFAYPTILIAIFTFVLAYLFSTTIIFAIMIKLYDWFEPMVEENTKKIGFFVLIIIPSWLTMLYIYCIVIVFLYSLIIGRGAVVNTGPLLIISIVPSALLSLVAWIAKRMVLNGSQNIRP